MSSLSANNQGNLKHVMRTALVGIKPADQVILKGYLRVLLRLEVDLEWVSANHPDVDLFFISHEFKHADNVIKLLAKQGRKPALYIKRSANEEGTLVGDELSLPLKKMDVLNQWLYSHVALLGATATRNTHTQNTPSNQSTQTEQTSQTPSQLTNPVQSSTAQSSTTDTHQAIPTHQALIRFIEAIHQPQADKQHIVLAGDIVATVDTKRQIVWQRDANIANIHALFADNLTTIDLVTAKDEPTGQPTDLKQWLWDNAWAKIDSLTPLISQSATFALRYWVKPSHGVERRDLLRIMTAMEHGQNGVVDIADMAGTSPMVTKQVLAGLLFAGYLDKSAYDNLAVLAVAPSVSSPTNTSATPSQSVDGIDAKASPLDAILSQRALGMPPKPQPASTITPTSQQTAQPAKSDAPEKKEKMGFLSKLRRKLGL
ncbi:hypothetical protein [Moraxella lincolnii]|uniref:hypothetical protein n=1 Tax=Lwoffella lincolnii TaxID=90241 RepID=UPI0030D59562